MAQRGASVVRHLQFGKALSHPVRVAAIHTQAKRANPVTNGVVSRSIARNALPSGVRVGLLTNAYATAAGRSKTGANKTTRATKTVKKGTKTTRGTKAVKNSKGTKTARGKKKTTKKAKPAPKPKKKELTEKQKEQKDAKEKRDKLRELKAQALVPPKKLPDNYYVVGFQLKLGDAIKTGQKASEAFKSASTLTKAAGEEEKQRYTETAESNKATNRANYENWVKSYTPLQIKEANLARKRLSKLTAKNVRPIIDDRLVKLPKTSYVIFFTERMGQGDFKHMALKDIVSKVAEEWKGLTGPEKEKYQNLQTVERERYERQYKQVYGTES